MEEMVHKVTLSSGKVVLLKDFKIKHQRLAAQSAAPKAGDNQHVLSMVMGEELIKILVRQIDGKDVVASQMEDLDSVLTYAEYNQLSQAVSKMTGQDDAAPKIEFVPFGGQ